MVTLHAMPEIHDIGRNLGLEHAGPLFYGSVAAETCLSGVDKHGRNCIASIRLTADDKRTVTLGRLLETLGLIWDTSWLRKACSSLLKLG